MNIKNNKIISFLCLFLLISGISYFIFDKILPASQVTSLSPSGTTAKTVNPETGVIAFSGNKTEVCPINGALFTKEEKDIWSTRRPLMVMIENHEDSRPQSGLQSADIVYETVAEGGITRFMGVFYCGIIGSTNGKYDVGPVRSARTYFLDLVSEYGDYPLYNHVGGANCSGGDSASKTATNCSTDKRAQALEQISQYCWNSQVTASDLNEFSLPYKACRREPDRTGDERATEHTMYCSTTELWNIAATRGLTNITTAKKTSWNKSYRPWSFSQKDQSNSSAATISFDFWPGYKAYSVSWKYDSANNNYVRSNGGKAQIDFNTQKNLTAKNIIIQYAKETRSIDEHGHLLYGVIGTGNGILFQNGIKTEITWSKASRTARTIFKDAAGKEINFVPGNIWVEILNTGSNVSYENTN